MNFICQRGTHNDTITPHIYIYTYRTRARASRDVGWIILAHTSRITSAHTGLGVFDGLLYQHIQGWLGRGVDYNH